MRIINLGGREIKITGSPMTPFYYKKAFKQSFSGDLAALAEMGEDLSRFDDINMLQMIWAMELTSKQGRDMEPFEKWLSHFDYLDLEESMEGVVEEAMNATFRDNKNDNKKHPSVTG